MKVCMAAFVRYATGGIWREQTSDNGFDICISATGDGFCRGIENICDMWIYGLQK